ncbi:MAG: CHASE2 domain-containing protein [Phormidium sp.]
MTKLITLKLTGDLDAIGFQVFLEISNDGDRPSIEETGQLPAAPELLTQLESHWLEKYRPLSAPYRIKSKGIEYSGSIQTRLKDCQESGKTLRDRLNQWLDAESFRDIDRLLRQQLKPDEDIRVLIRTNDSRLHKLPWHLWNFCQSYPNTEIALSPPKFQRRERFSSTGGRQKIRILAILGHRGDIDVEGDRQTLNNLPDAEVEFLDEPTRSEINDQLWDQPWDIIFFAGHSETEGDEGRIHINPTESLTIDELWYALRKAVNQGLQVAIFNSCDGLGLARRLDDLQIPITIVMRELIPDQVAHAFLTHFLEGFADGKPFYRAVREARERLQGMENQFPCASWLPVVCQHPWEDPPTWQGLLTPLTPPPSKTLPWWQGLGTVLVASVLVTSLVMGVRSLGWLEQSELNAYDHLLRSRPAEAPDPRLLIVKVTEGDLRRLGTDPITDEDLLRLFQRLEQYQPRLIGLNIFRDKPQEPGHQAFIQYLNQSDNVVAVCDMGKDDALDTRISPPPGLNQVSLGFSDIVQDLSDMVVRRHLLEMPAGSPCDTEFAFSFQLAIRYLEQEGYRLEETSENYFKIGDQVFRELTQTTGGYRLSEGQSDGSQILINYRAGRTVARTLTLSQVMDELMDEQLDEIIRDKIVLVGNEKRSRNNFYFTPYTTYNTPFPHVVLQAHLTSQILSAVLDNRPLLGWWSQANETLWIWAWSMIGGLLAWFSRKTIIFTFAIAVAGGTIMFAGFMLLLNGVWIPTVPAILSLCITGVSLIFYKESKS